MLTISCTQILNLEVTSPVTPNTNGITVVALEQDNKITKGSSVIIREKRYSSLRELYIYFCLYDEICQDEDLESNQGQ